MDSMCRYQAENPLDSQIAVSGVMTMSEHLSDLLVTERFSAVVMTTLAALGLFLAACGLYSVIAYTVSRQTHEIGIRMALGAGGGDVLRMVLRMGLRLIAIGVVAGLAASLGLGRLMREAIPHGTLRRIAHPLSDAIPP